MFRARDHDSWPTSVILDDRIDNPVLFFKNFFDRARLSIAEFDHALALRSKESAALAGNEAKKREPIRPAVQSGHRIEVADLRVERSDFGGRNVRRVAADQVKLALGIERLKGIAHEEGDSVADAPGMRIV